MPEGNRLRQVDGGRRVGIRRFHKMREGRLRLPQVSEKGTSDDETEMGIPGVRDKHGSLRQ